MDPSTDVTGIAVVSQEDGQETKVEYAKAIRADGKLGRWERIRYTRTQLSWLRHRLPMAFDAVAYENPFMRGRDATAAIQQAIGAYLSLSCFAGFEPLPVQPNSAKAALGCSRFLPTYETWKEREAGRQRGKIEVIHAVNLRFGLDLRDDEDAAADAIAVGLAALNILGKRRQIAEEKRLQTRLKLTTRRTRKPAKAAKL
jgi:Holliday junction resolvasome RuvABC endonuclease subunit